MEATARPALRKTAGTFEAGARTLPQRYFVSSEVMAEEEKEIFLKHWLLVGHQSRIPKAGDYFVQETAGESVIIARDRSGVIRGFYNVCRHRGTRLCEDSGGHSSTIQCPYHAWTYGLDGRLIGSPHMDDVPGFDRSQYSLHPANLELWEGFIFVKLGDDDMPLEQWFAPLAGKFSNWNLPRLRSVKRVEYDVKANWKLMFENYSECYHCPGVHPMLSKVSPYDSAENDLTEGPFLGGFMRINKGKSLTMSGEACALRIDHEQELAAASPSGGGHERKGEEQVFYYSIFPNMLLSMHPEYVMVHQLWPQAPDRTLIVCDWFFHPEAAERDDFNPEDAIEFWDVTNKQDWHVCELSQQGIASRAYEPGPYSSRESIAAAWDREYLKILGRPTER
ncbi:MAG: aromatic ring-hydroxylating dioxygenase subunit alpha [Verrucomicrobiota bacterium]|nr:aromatic ring-hydroxylating dioxygenase subunit alpha [Verrucomicrobiota bacterium]